MSRQLNLKNSTTCHSCGRLIHAKESLANGMGKCCYTQFLEKANKELLLQVEMLKAYVDVQRKKSIIDISGKVLFKGVYV